jgi:hypothetical protein
MGKYFWDNPKKPLGLNADIERHRKEEAKLLKAIEDSTDARFEITYRTLYCHLIESKAALLEKFGRK